MYYYRSPAKKARIKRGKTVRKFAFLAAVAALIAGIAWFFQNNVNPVIFSVSEASVTALTTMTVTKSVSEILASADYNELVHVEHDGDGNIRMLRIDTVKTNMLARGIAQKSQEELAVIGETGIEIPLGTLTGIPIFAGQGPDLSIKVLPVGAVTCSFTTEFITAGINQTLHKIIAEVVSDVKIILPGSRRSVNAVTEVLVSESILIGDVPEVYLRLSGLPASSINLV
jgi:sporulation protein YunB